MKTTTKYLMILSTVGLGLAAVSCDSTSTCTDAGVCPDGGAAGKTGAGGAGGATGAGGAGGAGPALYGLYEGTYCFDILTAAPASATSNGCEIDLVGQVGLRIPVTYTLAGTIGTVTVGTMGSLGTGTVDKNKGTLLRSGPTSDSEMPTCTWTQMDTSMLELTANNVFSVSTTEVQSGFAAACTGVPATNTCTSTFTLTLAVHSPTLMPDAVTGKCL